MPDPFGDAIKKLGLSADKLAKAADKISKLTGSTGRAAAEVVNRRAYEKRVRGGENLAGYQRDVDYSKAMGSGDGSGGRDRRSVWERLMERAQGGKQGKGRAGAGRTGAKGPAGGGSNLAGKAGGAAGIAVGVAQELNEMRKRIQEWTTAAIESKRKLADVSGAMARVFANREVKDMIREMQVGNRTAGSTGKLADAEDRRKNAAAPLEIALDNAKNEVLVVLNDKLTGIYNGVVDGLNKVISLFPRMPPDFLKKITDPVSSDAYAAFTGPGGILAQAAKIEADAAKRLDNVRRAGSPFFRSSAPPGRLP